MLKKRKKSRKNQLEGLINKYVPAKTVLFNLKSSEGYMAKIFKSKDSISGQKKLWTLSIPGAAGAGFYLHQIIGLGALYTYMPYLVVTPLILRAINHSWLYWKGYRNVSEVYLLKNGDQILVKTLDGIMHKLCIQDMLKYELIDRAKHMDISINNGGRQYLLSTKNKEFVNFELLDKIIKGVCIQTSHEKTRARPPANLRNERIVYVKPEKVLGFTRPTEEERKPAKQMEQEERDREIRERFIAMGVPTYNEKDFYATFKMSRTDFINKIKDLSLEEQKAEIEKLYDVRSARGRRLRFDTVEKNIKRQLEVKTMKPKRHVGLRSI